MSQVQSPRDPLQALPPQNHLPGGQLRLPLRSRVELFKGTDVWDEIAVTREIQATQLALLICDVWDDHWCRGAARRVDDLAPRIDVVVRAARARGVQIIHAPSDTMDFYADTPYRQRIAEAPRVPLPAALDLPNLPLPIDDSDGGCDTGEQPWRRAWTRQHPAIGIEGDDVVSDNGTEIYSFLTLRGIDTVLVAGVHTNMCVLNRSFGIKQMTRWGVRCVLVRDLTDAMYNPQRPPRVSHAAGTELVVQYVEKCWCPTCTSVDLLGSLEARGVES